MKNPDLKLKEKFGIELGPPDKTRLTLPEVSEELVKIAEVNNKTGFLYFLVEYVKVSHPSKGIINLKDDLYQWQWDAALDFINNTQIISLKSRQIGYSTTVGAYALWRALFFQSQTVAIVSLTQRESVTFLKRIKFIYDNLPPWLRSKTSEFAKTSVVFEQNASSITSLPNTEDPARGESLSLLIADEFAAFRNPKSFLAAGIPALSAGMLEQFTNTTLPSQLFIISTLPRNPIENEYLRILHNAQENKDSEFKVIDPSVEDIPQYQDEKWHKKQRETLGDRIYKIEILKQEVYDVENSFLSTAILERLKPTNPIRCDFLYPEDVDEEGYMKDYEKMIVIKDNYDPQHHYMKGLWVWENPLPLVSYIVVCDVATGRAEDYSVVQVFKLEGLEQVAEFRGKPDLEQFKGIVENIVEYYNNAKLSIERTGLGEATVSYFADTKNYENLYWHVKSKNKVDAGFPMNTATRANGLAMWAAMMSRDEFQIKSIRAINEIRGFGYTQSGRIEGIGAHDDIVMTLVQLAYLVNIGFAATDQAIQEHLVFGHLIKDIDEKEKKEEHKSKTLKYWEQDGMELDEESKEFLAMCEAAGLSLPLAIAELQKQKFSD